MLRRSHKKSKEGCLECKRRHVKCDERRPICRLCALSDRDCTYAFQPPLENPPTPGTSSHEHSLSPGDIHSQDAFTPSDITLSTTTPLSNPNSPDPLDNKDSHYQDSTLDEPINLNHMALLIHLITSKDLFGLGADIDLHPLGLSLGPKTSLSSPYLLHQVLAYSARHLAHLHPLQSLSYYRLAISLQTRAVSLFNSAGTHEVNKSNCVAILLFSSILGHHLLTDTLANRDSGGLDAFLTHYMHCLGLHRGIYTIARTAWPLLMESELEPILSWSSGFTSRQPRGNHCQQAKELVDGAQGLGEEGREACRLAIQYLQVGFDAVEAKEEEEGHRHQMIFSWMMLAEPEFTGLLKEKRPEALVLLAYYAVLLWYGRGVWQVGDAGRYVLGIIGEYLGQEWDYWLEYPRRIVEGA
ncbi:MAG: hypothetical protein M1820_008017 [Bogoriella megaspora]|nr:MAG: hypothetical protein M1820_008017 [Bogoriella megaspora]